ncbi:MAG: ABC transporter ATP-binding protein/permease [Coriobacteriales bacterium]|jgi:ATP-binding cassette subfamily B protein|nr:ABC transporter ATP-binding protein/permease [Coriobacteriales bacterium]
MSDTTLSKNALRNDKSDPDYNENNDLSRDDNKLRNDKSALRNGTSCRAPYIQRLLNLSAGGYRDLMRGVIAGVISNIVLLVPFMVILSAIITLLEPLASGQPLDLARLWLIFAAGIVAAALYAFAYNREYDATYTAAYSESEKLRVEVAERLRKLPMSFFNRRDLSELTTNMMADCASVEHTMSHVVPGLFSGTIGVVVACIALSFYDWRLSLALFAALPVSLGLIFLVRVLSSRMAERHVVAKLEVAEQTQEYLEGIKVVKAFGLAGEKSQALEASMAAMMRSAVRFEGLTGIFITLAMMIMQVGIGLVALVGVTLLVGDNIDAIKLFCFLVVSARIYAPLFTILTLLPEFFYLLVSTRRMQELRTTPVMEGNASVQPADYAIHLDGVSFAYENDEVLHDIDLHMKQGEVTALVGPSGSGKTTLARLMARFWDPQAGHVTIGGVDLADTDPEHLMSWMSFVFQDVVLFNDTVMANIRIGRAEATDEEVYHAARQARCDEFIARMPLGYDTLLGENGSTLSGGERQRISIARALLKDAPIVLLDEATSSLDPENETLIQEAVSALVRGRTVVVIAHRLRTVLDADHIVVLEAGRVVEQGRGTELLEQGGLFARLYGVQQQSLGWSVGG